MVFTSSSSTTFGSRRYPVRRRSFSASVSSPAIDILIVCLGNICRSPMAAVLLAARLEERGVDAHVHSAGLLSPGQRVPDHGLAVMAARGFDTSGHRSRRLSADLVDPAGLIVAMTGEQVEDIVAAHPAAGGRTFTLKEIVRRGEATGSRGAGEDLGRYLARLHAGRRPADLAGSGGGDDVDDPIGGSRAVYERTASEIEDLTARLAGLLAG
ncbi:MAG: low molecular weight phosphatase family protein [Acidimicrobiia bacterium]